MNAVEIEEAIFALAEQPFDAQEFPFAFLQAFGNKETTIKRLRKGESNKSNLGGVLQTNNIHIGVATPGEVTKTLAALKASPATARAKAKYVLATDGDTFEAEDLASGETVACAYADFPNHFGFFLPLAGITTVKQVRDSSFDIQLVSFSRGATESGDQQWTQLALQMLRRAPNATDVLSNFTNRFSPAMCEGSRATYMAQRVRLLDEIDSRFDPGLVALARTKRVELQDEVEHHRTWETKRDVERDESFE
jgi:hypothetical protein